jgi:hypothetical protein
LKASEVIPILQWVEKQDYLKAPRTALRSKTFRRGQSFFETEEESNRASSIETMQGQMAISKYGLFNRKTRAFSS